MKLILNAESAAIKRLIAAGKERGYVTVHELNATLPSGVTVPELVEDTLAMLRDFGIAVLKDGPEDGEAAPRSRGQTGGLGIPSRARA